MEETSLSETSVFKVPLLSTNSVPSEKLQSELALLQQRHDQLCHVSEFERKIRSREKSQVTCFDRTKLISTFEQEIGFMSKQLRDFMHQLKNGRSRDYDLESNVKDLKARIHSCKLLRDDHVAKLARSKELPCLQQEFNARLQALNLCKEDLPIAISVCEKRIKHIKKILDSISQENSNKQKIGRNAAKMVFGKEFWHLYYKDLHSAQREIIIVCKFISQGRVKSLAKVLSKAIARGVRVVVVIGPPAPEHVPLVELMMSVNIEVIIRDGFHQKLSVIDQNIAWHGSLNILSHWNDQGDQMCREQEPHMVQQILSGIKELLDG